MGSCSQPTAGVSPGLGFVHVSTAAAHVGAGGVRGAPRGESSADKDECCAKCLAAPACTVWVQLSLIHI